MSTTSTVEFSNLPTDAIGKIIEKCDLKEQLTLRKVSKDLRSLVDEQKLAYKSIEIISNDLFISCVYNDKDVVYTSGNWNSYMTNGVSVIRSDDYVKIALNDLSIALKNPKLRLDDLYLRFCDFSDDRINRFRLLLNSLNHQIHVETLIGNPEFLLSTLPFFKPKVLVNIEVLGGEDTEDWASKEGAESIRKISCLEQWKQAEQLTTGFDVGFFPAEFIMHFKRFVILRGFFDKDFLMNLRDLFSTSTNFQSCTVQSNNDENRSEFLQSFCEKVESGEEVIYRFKIPDDSNKVLEFKIFSRSPTFKHCNIECVYLPLIEELAVELGLRLEPGNYLPVFYQYLIPDSTDVLIYEFWMDHIEIRRVSYMEML
ncbi:hypothetical protein GCK72_021175 [Caenorhabditis remanei]|uniref:F-box domain-containing protein n=1 Tax=Caenorhabditis remanei TaxID=31234 RepID=A0A6A5GJD8_CAERE|nr:hypothetical protein GCK72_021175 [Caenorhabditis remanei]KAF1754612.1 hypothetical protein GCK72_021175 [Caenorhabditis remanei]